MARATLVTQSGPLGHATVQAAVWWLANSSEGTVDAGNNQNQHTDRNQPSPCFARQPHEVAGFVNEEQIARVVKILPLEILGSELELDFIVA